MSTLRRRRKCSSGQCCSRSRSLRWQRSRRGYTCSKNRVTLFRCRPPCYVICIDTSPTTASVHWLLLIHSVISFESGCQLICSEVCKSLLTLRLVWCFGFGFVAMTTSCTDALEILHWLRLQNWLTSKSQSWRFECCKMALSYLDQLVRVADLPGCSQLHVPAYQLQLLASLVSVCCIHHLELPATWHSVVVFSVCFSSMTIDIPVSQIFSWHTITVLFWWHTLSWTSQ